MLPSPTLVYLANPANAPVLAAAGPIAAVGISAVVGAAVGGLAAVGIEMGLREFEDKFKIGTYKARFWTAQGIRSLVFGSGVALSTTALFGLIVSGSITASVCIASGGIALAVVAAVGIGLAFTRYKYGCAEEKRKVVQTLLVEFDLLSVIQIRTILQTYSISMDDVHNGLRDERDHQRAGRIYIQTRVILERPEPHLDPTQSYFEHVQ
jgi:hypothetical protein